MIWPQVEYGCSRAWIGHYLILFLLYFLFDCVLLYITYIILDILPYNNLFIFNRHKFMTNNLIWSVSNLFSCLSYTIITNYLSLDIPILFSIMNVKYISFSVKMYILKLLVVYIYEVHCYHTSPRYVPICHDSLWFILKIIVHNVLHTFNNVNYYRLHLNSSILKCYNYNFT